MSIDRRTILRIVSAGVLAPALMPFLALGDAMAAEPWQKHIGDKKAHADLGAVPDLQLHGGEQIAMLLYPGFTALDLVGPHYMFACMMGGKRASRDGRRRSLAGSE